MSKTIKNSLYSHLFEALQIYAEEDLDNDEVMDDIFSVLEDEVYTAEPVTGIEGSEIKVTRLGVINTVINALLPGYRLVVEVNTDTEEIGETYLVETE